MSIKKVLVIDDDDLFYGALRLTLAQAGITDVDYAENGQEGMDLLRINKYDLIFLDLIMPVMDGIALMQAASDYRISTPIVLLSGGDSTVLNLAKRIGSQHHIHIVDAIEKPINLRAVERILLKAALAPQAKTNDQYIPLRKTKVISRVINNQAPFVAYYQPQFDLNSNQPYGAEALIRWQDDERGIVPPIGFLGSIEEAGLIGQVTQFIIQQILKDLSDLVKIDPSFKLSFNVSLSDLSDARFVDDLHDSVLSYNLSPRNLTLEIVETMALSANQTIATNLARARIKGFGIALDDFGTGASTMAQLQEMPCNILKIDQMFLRGNKDDMRLLTMLESCVSLGKALELSVVAEGIETAEELTIVKAFEVDSGQGFYYARPMPIKNLLSLLKNTTHTSEIATK